MGNFTILESLRVTWFGDWKYLDEDKLGEDFADRLPYFR